MYHSMYPSITYIFKSLYIDIDECVTGAYECKQFCNNMVGGYNCSCSDGYYLGHSGFDCLSKTYTLQYFTDTFNIIFNN